MKKIILGLIMLISPFFLSAHNPLSAVYRLESKNNQSVLNVYLTQASVNKALVDIHGSAFMDSVSIKEFKELIVDYVKSNFKLNINGVSIELKKGGIRYGNHQTDLTFITSALPAEIDEIDVEITAFKNTEFHQTIFTLGKNDGTREKIVLNSGNDFKSSVDFKEGDGFPYFILITVILVVILILIMYTRRRKISMLRRVKLF